MLMTIPKKGLKIAEGLRSSGQEKRTCQIATLVGVKGLLTFRIHATLSTMTYSGVLSLCYVPYSCEGAKKAALKLMKLSIILLFY